MTNLKETIKNPETKTTGKTTEVWYEIRVPFRQEPFNNCEILGCTTDPVGWFSENSCIVDPVSDGVLIRKADLDGRVIEECDGCGQLASCLEIEAYEGCTDYGPWGDADATLVTKHACSLCEDGFLSELA